MHIGVSPNHVPYQVISSTLYRGPPIHTLTIFANPFMEGKPSVGDEGVRTVSPGEEAPTEGDWHTLYFLPGLHDIGLNFTIYPGWTRFR